MGHRTREAVRNLAASMLVCGFAAIAVSAEDVTALPELVSEASGLRDASGKVASWRIKVSALSGRDEHVYKYVFENRGDSRILIDLSDQSSLGSKLQGLADYLAISLGPGESRIVRFSALSSPETLVAPVSVGIWDQEEQVWALLAGGKASLYVPSSPNMASGR